MNVSSFSWGQLGQGTPLSFKGTKTQMLGNSRNASVKKNLGRQIVVKAKGEKFN